METSAVLAYWARRWRLPRSPMCGRRHIHLRLLGCHRAWMSVAQATANNQTLALPMTFTAQRG